MADFVTVPLLERLAKFAAAAFDASFEGCDFGGDSIQDEGVSLGLLVTVEYDPEKHGESTCDQEPGDDYFEYAPDFKAALSTAPAAPVGEDGRTWMCFHCDEVFADRALAAEHFGWSEHAEVACRLNEVEGGVVALLRQAHAELSAYRDEDTKLIREVYGLGSKHQTEKREANEKGYADGLRDGRAESPPSTPTAREQALEAALTKVRDRFFPADQPERDQDILWDEVNSALSASPSPAAGEKPSRDAAFESFVSWLWGEGFRYVETLDPDAKHKSYYECQLHAVRHQ